MNRPAAKPELKGSPSPLEDLMRDDERGVSKAAYSTTIIEKKFTHQLF